MGINPDPVLILMVQLASVGITILVILWKMGRDKGESLSEMAGMKRAIEDIRTTQDKLLRFDLWAEAAKGISDRIQRVEERVRELERKS